MLLLSFSASAFSLGQVQEVGVGIGALSYSGDLFREYKIQTNRPAIQLHYRVNYSEAVSVRAHFMGGQLTGSDKYADDITGALRDASFNLFLLEGGLTVEYHFLDYKSVKAVANFSPYFFTGITAFGIFGAEDSETAYSKVQPAIPIGIGFKILIDPKWSMGIEFGARHTFFDFMDNVSGPPSSVKNYQYGSDHDNDFYYFLGVSLIYSIYGIKCPFYY